MTAGRKTKKSTQKKQKSRKHAAQEDAHYKMSYSIINTQELNHTKQPLFFGEGLGLQRYDTFRYKKYYDSFLNQISAFWRPEEVDITNDAAQFKQLPGQEKHIFTENLGFQTLLDSVQTRGIPNLLRNCSNLEFEACANAWMFFEQIHSYSYTYIIKNIYANPSEVFDSFSQNKDIINRVSGVTKYYDKYIDSLGSSIDEQKEALYLTLVSINILEGIRFYVSFACSFAFAERGQMEGNAKIISLIQRDEQKHLAVTQNTLNYLRKEAGEGFQSIVKKCEPIVRKMYEDSANEEIQWANYLFKDGGMLGLNADILTKFMFWLTNKRMKAIGLTPLNDVNKNPLNWMNSWMNSRAVQVAPQETENESYQVGAVKQDASELDLGDFKL
jgi:ribonucleoside-diphosphate reductase beta chain